MADEVNITIDQAAIAAEVAKLDQSTLAEQLTKFRVRQKVQQKKQYAKGGQKKYQLQARAKFNAMKELALNTPATQKGFANLWEQVNASAEQQAEAKMEEAATQDVGEEAEEASA